MQDLTTAAWRVIEWLMSLLEQDDIMPQPRREPPPLRKPAKQQDLPRDSGLQHD